MTTLPENATEPMQKAMQRAVMLRKSMNDVWRAALSELPAPPAELDNRVQQRGPEGNLEEYDPSNAVEELHQEIARLRARIEAAHRACGEAVDKASRPRQKHAAGLSEPIGRDRSEWDWGYKNGVQACATVVWAALTHRRV